MGNVGNMLAIKGFQPVTYLFFVR